MPGALVLRGNLIGIGDEGDALEEGGEIALGIDLREVLRDGVELGQVLHP